ncbi:MAG: hypothetical protein U0525_05175 [Patescibacteria group bacterium]
MKHNRFVPKIQRLLKAALVAAGICLTASVFIVPTPAMAQEGTPAPAPISMAPASSIVCDTAYANAATAAKAELMASITISPSLGADFTSAFNTTMQLLDTQKAECFSARQWLDMQSVNGAVAPSVTTATTACPGGFTTYAAKFPIAGRYRAPAGNMAWPGDGYGYSGAIGTYGDSILVCPEGFIPPGQRVYTRDAPAPAAPVRQQPAVPQQAVTQPTAGSGSTGTCAGGWPTNAEQATSYFGGGTWELSAEGGWHMIEQHNAIHIDPCGNTMEAYFDTAPGKDPVQFVSVVPMAIQGGTIWNGATTSPSALFCAMDEQKGHPTGPRAIQQIGFGPVTCP